MKDIYDDQNVAYASDVNSENKRFGEDVFRNLKELQIGAGDTVFRVDRSGIWLGASTFEDAPFSVDMDGNIVATSIVVPSLRTATSGERIEIGTTDTNQILFYDDDALYGVLEVHDVSGTGYISLGVVAGDDIEVGVRIDTDIGASGYNSVAIVSNGGGFYSSGNASTGINIILGKTTSGSDKFFGVKTVATVDYVMTDLLPTSDPGVSGALWNSGGTVKISP